ncbi:helicase-related protein [Rosistilla oblonga]|uniref:helicase-related protein n=1 Tax=Rosistilla oblonga TaxID=2527990 RepID=UPI003A98221A
MQLSLNPSSIEDYQTFLRIKQLPSYRITGRLAEFPDEYADRLGLRPEAAVLTNWEPSSWLFDYQRAIVQMAIEKRKFAIFADCGLGKTPMLLEFAQAAASNLQASGKQLLIVSPLMVINQTVAECQRFYGFAPEIVKASNLQEWMKGSGSIGITNYEALNSDLRAENLGGLVLDESSYLKSHYGKWGQVILKLGAGLDWKLCCTGTPAPNDRIEYANHAVFLDQFQNVNAFLATYFVNKGQTQERWVLKPHALEPFYRALSHWSFFLTNPATYGWKDNAGTLPPINVHIHDVELTAQQREIVGTESGELFATRMGGITSRSVMGQIAKGNYRGEDIETNKPRYIRELVESWPDESTIIWCLYNREQERLEKEFPEAASIVGSTPMDKRERLIEEFKAGERKILISKPKILGFGLNLQVATRQVFSGLQDSYESYYQAVKRSNRIGSTKPLNVHIPVTDIEQPMIETVLAKAKMVQQDTEMQETLFRKSMGA